MYDAIIVGARCAGSPTAMLLARKGHRVLLVDRAHFPSDTLSTHFIQQPGVALLARWGLLEPLLAVGTPPVAKAAVGSIDAVSPFEIPEVPGVPGPLAPRRTILDKLLVDGAKQAGAELREGFTFQDLVIEDGRVTGITGRGEDGQSITESARIVIGADGRNSSFASKVGAERVEEVPPLTCGYYSYWSGVPSDSAEVYFGAERSHIVFPTNDGLTVVIALWPVERFSELRRDAERHYTAAVETAPLLSDRIRSGKREERIFGTGELDNFLRRPVGPGWALVGDAGYHKDPTPADGISDAFTAADTLSEAVDSILAERSPEDESLASYQRQRDETALPHFRLCMSISSFETPIEKRAADFAENAALSYLEALAISQTTQQATPA